MTMMQIYDKVWKVAPSFIGGPTNDDEARAIMKLAIKIRSRMANRYFKLTVGELVAVACAKYFGS